MNEIAIETLTANETVFRLTSRLSDVGYQVTRSFDLQTARAELRAPEECPCPNHGSAACTCQYVILLVNKVGEAPITLVIHGHDNRTLVTVGGPADRQPPEALERAIRELVINELESDV
jgi:hypothetical protein